MNTVEQNRKDFIAFVRKQLNKCGIKLNLRTSKKHLMFAIEQVGGLACPVCQSDMAHDRLVPVGE